MSTESPADGSEISALPDHVVPAAEAAPPAGEAPEYHPKINNLAGDDELCGKVKTWLNNQLERFRAQDARITFCGDGGTMDLADRMYRVALRRDENSAQFQNTLSDVTSTAVFRAQRAVTTSENAILFQSDDIPGEYEPELNTAEYDDATGRAIAAQHNLLEQFTFDEDKRVPTIKKINRLRHKYGHVLVGCEWDYETREVTDREPVPQAGNEPGQPVQTRERTRRRVVKDWPSLSCYDMKDFYADAQIDGGDLDLHRAYFIKTKKAYEQLASAQANGQIMNLDRLNASALYQGEDSRDETLESRLTNAGEDVKTEADGLFLVWECWAMLPIKEYKGKRRGKGKLDAATPPQRYWATFAGDMNGSAVCLRLIRNPYNDAKVPHRVIYEMDDDKGLYHQCYVTMLPSLYWQACTNINQAFDNVTLQTRAPMTTDGPVYTRDLTFKANKLIKTARGVRLEVVKVPNTTPITIPMADRVEGDIHKTMGADKPITAEALGARASATEASQVLDQALLPIDESTTDLGDQLIVWLLEKDAALWRQFADPSTVVFITKNNMIYEVRPTRLWGPLRIKVTAVSRFRNNVIRRRELNSFIQNVLPIASQIMGRDGMRTFFRWVFSEFGIVPKGDIFPESGDFDARNRAIDAVYRITALGEWVEPRQEENHSAWLAILEPAAREYALLPQPDRNDDRMRMLNRQIEIRKGYAEQMAAAGQQQGQGPQAQMANAMRQQMPGQPEQGMMGEMVGNMNEAEQGAIANA